MTADDETPPGHGSPDGAHENKGGRKAVKGISGEAHSYARAQRMVFGGGILRPGQTLDSAALAFRIEHEHRLANRDARSALEHALECGRLLTEAKAAAGHGGWIPWIEANLSFGDRQAQKYMRLAAHRAELSNPNSGADFTINGALAELATPRPPERNPRDSEDVTRALGRAMPNRSDWGKRARGRRLAEHPAPVPVDLPPPE